MDPYTQLRDLIGSALVAMMRANQMNSTGLQDLVDEVENAVLGGQEFPVNYQKLTWANITVYFPSTMVAEEVQILASQMEQLWADTEQFMRSRIDFFVPEALAGQFRAQVSNVNEEV